MSRRRRLWLMLPRQLRELPADLAAVLALVAVTNAFVFLPYLRETPVRVVVGLAFVLFVPGYAFIAALFPEAGESPVDQEGASGPGESGLEAADDADDADADTEESTDDGPDSTVEEMQDRGIDGVERVALSFGLSIAIVPLIGLALNFTPFGIRLTPIMASVSLFTVGATAVAAYRRLELPAADRFQVPYRSWLAAGRAELFEPDSQLDAALNVALVLAVLLATSSVVYAVAVPPQGEQFTEFYLLTEDDDGELVADNYPEAFTVGEAESLYVGIGNNEHETVDYTVVVQLQRVEGGPNGTEAGEGEGNVTAAEVVERVTVERWSVAVEHNETWQQQREIGIDAGPTGEDLRLKFLLYQGSPPEEPTAENAYRDLHLWVDVEPSGGADA